MRPIRTHLAGWLLATVAGACGAPAPRRAPAVAGESRTVTDDAGRQVVVAVPAHRVVSLAPSLTELLFALGVGDHVVGRTTWCRYPPAALTVPAVGDGLNPDVEAVAARRPDLVLLYRSPLTETAARQFAGLGIPSLVLRDDRIEDVSRTARLLGTLTGAKGAGDSIAGRLDSLVAAPSPSNGNRPRLAVIAWDNPPIVIGGGSYLDELMTLAGAMNVFGDLRSASATVSLETIVTRNPDWIAILVDSATPARPPAWTRRAAWRAVPAVRDGRFLYLSGELFGQPSPRAPSAVATLRRLLASRP
jgi:iron complex transport system substrate-binding protein